MTLDRTDSTQSSAQPTAVRYGVLFFLCTLALLLYIDRVCIGEVICSKRQPFLQECIVSVA